MLLYGPRCTTMPVSPAAAVQEFVRLLGLIGRDVSDNFALNQPQRVNLKPNTPSCTPSRRIWTSPPKSPILSQRCTRTGPRRTRDLLQRRGVSPSRRSESDTRPVAERHGVQCSVGHGCPCRSGATATLSSFPHVLISFL